MDCRKDSRHLWVLAAALLALTISLSRCSREAGKSELSTVPDDAAEVAQKYLECAKHADAVCAADLFHYPKDETPDERRADVEAVRHSVSVITKHFGTIGSIQNAPGHL